MKKLLLNIMLLCAAMTLTAQEAPEKLIRDEFTNGGTIGVSLFRVWRFTIRFIVPLCIILIFLHQFGIL